MPPNIVLIVMDTARADGFEPYGAPAGTTPTVAQLARRGAALPSVYATASWTVPSHVSMLARVLPRSLGVGQVPGGPHSVRPRLEQLGDRLLPVVLGRAGYRTAAVSANLWIQPAAGFDIGFESFYSPVSHRTSPPPGKRGRRALRGYVEALQARLDDGADAARDKLREWLGNGRDKPFFWFVNLMECHTPYMPPKPFNRLPWWERLLAAGDVRRYEGQKATWSACLGGLDVPAHSVDRMRRLYAQSVAQMDAWLAGFLEMLDSARLLDDTLVVLTSDHGENLGEGNLLGHAFSIDERLIRVPFVWAGPGAEAREGVTSLLDLAPMLAAAAGASTPPAWDELDPALAGVGVAQLDPMLTPDDPRGPDVVAEWHLPPGALRRFTVPMTCATDGCHKLVRDGDDEHLYELASDPLEQHPGAPGAAADAAGVSRLRAAIDAAMATAAPLTRVEAPAEEREALERQMRLLGYL